MGRSLRLMAVTLVLVTLVLPLPAQADYETGQRSWDAGRTDEALAQWRSAAGAGDRRAMLALGRRYVQGLGVLQDYVEAHKWLNLAASRGEAAALKERDAVAEKMTPEERAEAQRRARVWRPGGGQAGVAAADAVGTEPAAPVAAWEGRPTPTVVREAQRLLGTLGYRAGPADGIWGRLTGEAYRAFLRDAGLPVASTLTPEALRTMRAIARLEAGEAETATVAGRLTPQVTTPAPASRATTAAMVPQITISDAAPPPSAIREAQALLAQLGYAPGPADGRWNKSTARSYRAFVGHARLPVSETLTPEALRAMRATARRQGGGNSSPGTAVAGSAAPAALHRAAQAGDITGLTAALAAGADIDALDGRGRTALMYAVDKGYVLLVEPLLEAKADPDIRAPDGPTALFMAIAHGHTEIVAMLMKAGADVSIYGSKGKTAVDVARLQYGEPEAAREKGMDAAVLALLDGKTWAAVQEEERRKADDTAWARADRLGTAASYGEYASSNPMGRHVSKAQRREAAVQEEERRKADDIAWARADRLGTAASYGEYASSNPMGRHVSKARRREAAVQEKAERAERVARKWPRGKKLRDCEVCPEMVVIPAGRYRMGSPSTEKDRDSDEGPVHDVTIWEPLAVGIHEVTKEEFRQFVKETHHSTGKDCVTFESGKWKNRSGRSWKKPGFSQDKRHPVVCVSWADAKAYVGWLSIKTGEAYRLLSESEWEYAARGGTRTSRYWGEAETSQCRYANGGDKALRKRYSKWIWKTASCNDKRAHTSSVGGFQPNGFGLHEMLGNVWEWVENCWHSSYQGAPTDGSAWTRGGDCSKRVLRGGSWLGEPGNLRSASRFAYSTGNRSSVNGLRVARTLNP